ncbi:hypothetical protein FG386_002739 [Cryptosporidium ryanae]|uniref:uncharacterized protein n=1 Tax=Cryptosporidium ryanae TaxID=515981 RepID=UPI003519F75D|nr:hypothetical protein FG386_002739 [Cryptosporidium ryanae]
MNKVKSTLADDGCYINSTPVSKRGSIKNGVINKSPIVLSSRTRRVEKPGPKFLRDGNDCRNSKGPVGVERIIKYLHAQDACMHKNTSLLHDDKNKIANSVAAKEYKWHKLLLWLAVYATSLLFFLLTVFSVYRIIERRDYLGLGIGLESVIEVIKSVETPSVESTYYISKESTDNVREAFEYLRMGELGENGDLNGVKNAFKEKRKETGKVKDYEVDNYGYTTKSSKTGFNTVNRNLSIENYDSAQLNIKAPSFNMSIKANMDMDLFGKGFQLEENGNATNEYEGWYGKNVLETFDLETEEKVRGNNTADNGISLINYVLNGRNPGSHGIDTNNIGIMELLCYPEYSYQEGMINLYYKELEYGINMKKHFTEKDIGKNLSVIKAITDENKLDMLGFERPYELIIYMLNAQNIENNVNLIKVDRKVIISTGYDNEKLENLCLKNKKWLCSKYEMLVLKLLLKLYSKNDGFLTLFLKKYKENIVNNNNMDNIAFFNKNQINIVSKLYPELLDSYINFKKGIYNKVNVYLSEYYRKTVNYDIYDTFGFEKVTEYDIDWITSFVISHSIKDRNGNIAFSPYYVVFPHDNNIFDNYEKFTVFHSMNDNSINWNYDSNFNKNSKKRSHYIYKKIYTHYGQLNNIKLLLQYGKILFNNEYFTTWFIRKNTNTNEISGNLINFKYSTSVTINSIHSNIYKELLPDWLVNIRSKYIAITDAMNDYVHYISINKQIKIEQENEYVSDNRKESFKIDCNEYSFYNGVGTGFGTIQFNSLGTVGGIESKKYVCLRELLFNYEKSKDNTVRRWDTEVKLINIIYNNCSSRYKILSEEKDMLIKKLNYYKLNESGKNILNYSSKLKQEIRIYIKLFYSIYEELNTMKKCTNYFHKLIQLIDK